MSEQLSFFDPPPIDDKFTVSLKPLQHPIWTEHKAKLIERYLYYFVLVSKHGTYIDGFAGPQAPDKPDTWAAKLVLESEPRWLRKIFFCDDDAKKVSQLEQLRDAQPPRRPNEPKRLIEVSQGDFNSKVHEILGAGHIDEKEAAFCLLDQRTFECHWSTVEALARHKQRGMKIELLYFLPDGWLDRAFSGLRDESIPKAWWGRDDWQSVRGISSQDRAALFCKRFQDELHYKSAINWPIFQKADGDGGRVMYYMIHATDHPEAPNLMHRAYRNAIGTKETPEQFKLEFEKWHSSR